MKKKSYAVVVAFCFAIVFLHGPLFAKSLTLRVGHDIPPFATPAKGVDHWAKLVNQKTEGRINVQVFPSSSLCDQKSSIDMLQAGAADGYLINFASHRTLFPLLSVESLPGLGFPDTVAGHVAHGEAIKVLVDKYPSVAKEVADIKIIMVIVSPNSVLLSSNKKIQVPDDIKGLKVGGNGARLELAKLIGAAPVFDVIPTAYQKLQTGVLDATTIGFQAVGEFKIYEVAKYALDISWGQGGLPLVMTRNTWEKIAAPDREVVLEAGKEGQLSASQAAETLTEKGKTDLLAHNGQITVPTEKEKALWRVKFQMTWDNWVSSNEAAGLKDAKSVLTDWQQKVENAWRR